MLLLFHLVFNVLLIKTRIFSILIDSFSLNIFSSSLPHLLQILGRSSVLSQTYDTLVFLNSLYFLYNYYSRFFSF